MTKPFKKSFDGKLKATPCVMCNTPTGRFWVGIKSKITGAVICVWCIDAIKKRDFMNNIYGDIHRNFEFSTAKEKAVNKQYYKPNFFKRDSKGRFIRNR